MPENLSPDPEKMQTQEQIDPRNPVVKFRDQYKEHASDLQRNVAETQAARYESALLMLMERSGNDTTLVNALNELTMALNSAAMFGNPEEPIHPEQTQVYAQKIQTLAEDIRSQRGGRATV